MDKLTQIASLLVGFAFSTYILIVVLRFLLQTVRADFYNPLSQFIVKATNPVLLPLRRVIPGIFGIDLSSILLAIVLQVVSVQILGFINGASWYPVPTLIIYSILELLRLVLNIYFFSFLIMVVISWIAPQTHNPVISIIHSITEPVLRPIRRVVPPLGGLDFSVMVAMLGIYILKIIIA